MHIKESLINFLYDKNYFITLYDNEVYVFNYKKLIILASTVIKLEMDKFIFIIKGSNLCIKKMYPNEILIKGSIKECIYE